MRYWVTRQPEDDDVCWDTWGDFSLCFSPNMFSFLQWVHHKYRVSDYNSLVSLLAMINKSYWHRLSPSWKKYQRTKLEAKTILENRSQKVRLPFKCWTGTLNYVFYRHLSSQVMRKLRCHALFSVPIIDQARQ